MAIDVSGIVQAIGQTNFGLIPPEIIAIAFTIVIAIIIVNNQSTEKAILALAPVSLMLLTIGFNISILFILLVFIMYGIILFVGMQYNKQVISQEN